MVILLIVITSHISINTVKGIRPILGAMLKVVVWQGINHRLLGLGPPRATKTVRGVVNLVLEDWRIRKM